LFKFVNSFYQEIRSKKAVHFWTHEKTKRRAMIVTEEKRKKRHKRTEKKNRMTKNDDVKKTIASV